MKKAFEDLTVYELLELWRWWARQKVGAKLNLELKFYDSDCWFVISGGSATKGSSPEEAIYNYKNL